MPALVIPCQVLLRCGSWFLHWENNGELHITARFFTSHHYWNVFYFLLSLVVQTLLKEISNFLLKFNFLEGSYQPPFSVGIYLTFCYNKTTSNWHTCISVYIVIGRNTDLVINNSNKNVSAIPFQSWHQEWHLIVSKNHVHVCWGMLSLEHRYWFYLLFYSQSSWRKRNSMEERKLWYVHKLNLIKEYILQQ